MATPNFDDAFERATQDIAENLSISDERKAAMATNLRALLAHSQDQLRSFTDDDGVQFDLIFRTLEVTINKDYDNRTFSFHSKGTLSVLVTRPDGHASLLVNPNFRKGSPLSFLDATGAGKGVSIREFNAVTQSDVLNSLPLAVIKDYPFFNTALDNSMHALEGSMLSFSEKGGRLTHHIRQSERGGYYDQQGFATSDFYFKGEPNIFGDQTRVSPGIITSGSFSMIGITPTAASDLSEAFQALRYAQLDQRIAEIEQYQQHRLTNAGVDTEQLKQYGLDDDPIYTNFLLMGKGNNAVKYRAEFLIRSNMMLRAAGQDDEYTYPKKTYNNLAFSFIAPNGRQGADSITLDNIDQGVFPAARMCERYGFRSISKKQFAKAMRWVGTQTPWGQLRCRNLDKALALSKIPDEWLTLADGSHLFDARVEGGLSIDAVKTLENAMPQLEEAGRTFDRLIQKGDKAGQKALAAKWAWLRGSAPLEDKISAFDAKYQINASMSDYTKLLSQFLESAMSRAVVDHPHIDAKSAFNVDEDALELTLDAYGIERALRTAAEANFDPEDHRYYDEDFEEWVEMAADEVLDFNLRVPEREEIRSELRRAPEFISLAKLNQELHKAHATLVRQANLGTHHNYQWTPLVDHPVNLGDNAVATCIDNRLDLLLEGSEMDHCVFSYLNACLAGESVIFSVRDKHSDERLATIELKQEEDDEGEPVFEIVQCYGKHNETNEITRQIERDMEDWLELVNNDTVPTNAAQLKENSEHLDDIAELVMDDPGGNGDLMRTIPYNNDAAFLSYFAFEQYTPEGITVESVLESSSGNGHEWYGVLHESGFKETIDTIKRVAELHQLPPLELITHKLTHGLNDWHDVPNHKARLDSVNQGLNAILNDYQDVLSVDQLYIKCAELASEHDMQFANANSVKQTLKKGAVSLANTTLVDVAPTIESRAHQRDEPARSQGLRR